ncbi:putative PPE family protein [Mycobacterium tuberculosis]|uniref:Putative PPE family protein n=1 Tax=Mycobacterium tuberculosis TaxID=1773 RepID=A0A655AMB9_MYCTX|nr:putative PPE family protein [Mycobacterium tuberculosis]
MSSGILASALGSTGGLQHGLANVLNSGLTNTPVAAPASAPVGGLDSGNPNPGSGSAAAGSGANPGLRSPGTSYPSFVNSGSNDSGLRNTAVREPSTPGSGIPKSNFYPSPDRESAYASPRIGQPVGSE